MMAHVASDQNATIALLSHLGFVSSKSWLVSEELQCDWVCG